MITSLMFRRLRCRLSEGFRRIKRSDRREAIRQFEKRFGYRPRLDKPRTYSEKLTRFKLEANRPLYRQLADKLAVRDFVEKTIGDSYLIPLIASSPRLTKELFASLPNRFAIKANHGSAMNHIVFDKADVSFEALKKETDRWLCRNFYLSSRETQYQQIQPQLVIEQLLLDDSGCVPADYKIHCFSQKGERYTVLQVDSDRFGTHSRDYFTADWQWLPLKVKYPNSSEEQCPARPDKLNALLDCAWALANGFAYVRVDLYVVKGQIYFGEMTFTPGSGFMLFEPRSFDQQWGEWFDLDHQLSLHTLADLETAKA